MSDRGPTTELPHDFYGRIVKLEVQTHPQKLWGIGLVLLLLGVLFFFFGMRMDDDGPIVALCGIVLVPIAIFMIYSAIQITNMPTRHVKLGLKTLRYPRGALLWRAVDDDVKLLSIPHVALVTQNGQVGVRFTHPDGSTHTLQQAWLPKGWSIIDLYLLLQMRIRGARQQLDKVQQVAAEAQVFADAETLGVVMDTRRKKKPVAYALIYDIEDYGTLLEMDDFPHTDHRLVVASDRVEAVQDAVKESIVSSLDVELEKR